jgi:hypothetical protein
MKVLGIRENIIIYYKKSYSLIMSMKIRVLALLIGSYFSCLVQYYTRNIRRTLLKPKIQV